VRQVFHQTLEKHNINDLSKYSVKICAITKADGEPPDFILDRQGLNLIYWPEHQHDSPICTVDNLVHGVSLACVIEADLSNLRASLPIYGTKKKPFWKVNFEVGILFGATELAASIIWTDSQVCPSNWLISSSLVYSVQTRAVNSCLTRVRCEPFRLHTISWICATCS
jgi:hypothetical protein